MRTALVTGVSKGIGRAIAERLLADGWQVFGISRSNPQLTASGFTWLEFDLMQFDKYGELAAKLPEQLHLLVNNAGIAYKVDIANLLTLDLEKQFAINVKAPIWLIHTLLPRLAAGSIINIASIAARHPYAGLSVYSATKAALVSFANTLAVETEVPICSVLPSSVDTPLLRTMYGAQEDYATELQPADIAGVVATLVGDGFESGSEIVVINKHQLDDVRDITAKVKIINVDDTMNS